VISDESYGLQGYKARPIPRFSVARLADRLPPHHPCLTLPLVRDKPDKMKTAALASLALAVPALAAGKCKNNKCKRLVDSESLQELITLDDLLAGSQTLQDIADAHGGHRAFGSGGHNATVDYLYNTLKRTGYYNVEKQPFTELYAEGTGTLSVDGAEVASTVMTYSPSGAYTGPLVLGNGIGCTAEDYPDAASGAVVMVQRGECPFGQKSALAAAAGAAGLIVYNNEAGELSGTLGEPFGEYAASLGVSLEDGEAIVAALAAGEVTVDFNVDAVIENRVNYNVIAETKSGDHDNVLVLGGHSDSVPAGPGIK
jgi:Zn-dependent M28 family amino/carboxypeptidase